MYRNNCNFSISRKKQMKKKSPTEDKKEDSKLKKQKNPVMTRKEQQSIAKMNPKVYIISPTIILKCLS